MTNLTRNPMTVIGRYTPAGPAIFGLPRTRFAGKGDIVLMGPKGYQWPCAVLAVTPANDLIPDTRANDRMVKSGLFEQIKEQANRTAARYSERVAA